MKSAETTLTRKQAAEAIRVIEKDLQDKFGTWAKKEEEELLQVLKALEAPPAAERTAQRDAALEIRTRIIDILDECDRTVYAQQKWKVAHAGLQGWLFKVEAENPEIIREVVDASEGTKSE